MGQAEDPQEPRPSDHYPRLFGLPISRRVFIRAAAGSAAGFVLYRGWGLPSSWASAPRPLARAAGPFLNELHLGALRPDITAPKPSLVFQAVRTEDMLYLGFEFYNAHTEVLGGQVHIVPTDKAKPTYMVVVFPSQHLGEQSIEYTPGVTTWPLSAPPRRSRRLQLARLRARARGFGPVYPAKGCSTGRRSGRSSYRWKHTRQRGRPPRLTRSTLR